MAKYYNKNHSNDTHIICETTENLPENIVPLLMPFYYERFGKDYDWLSTPDPKKMLAPSNRWCLAVRDGTISAGLFIEQQLSGGRMMGITKSLMSDGRVKGIGKVLISIAATESLKTFSSPTEFTAYLRVLKGTHNVRSMMAFNKAGYFSIVPPTRVPIEPVDAHLLQGENEKDGFFSVQRLDGVPKQIREHANWVAPAWEAA